MSRNRKHETPEERDARLTREDREDSEQCIERHKFDDADFDDISNAILYNGVELTDGRIIRRMFQLLQEAKEEMRLLKKDLWIAGVKLPKEGAR